MLFFAKILRLTPFPFAALVLLGYYCLLILLASVLGGMLPDWLRLTHRRMEIAVSFVAGVMLGVAVLHLLPHALMTAPDGGSPDRYLGLMLWMLAGFLAMFFVERFFCFHHHEAPDDDDDLDSSGLGQGEIDAHHNHTDHARVGHDHVDHGHAITWSGATLGLTLHSVMAGVAMAASVLHGHRPGGGTALAGFGTFLAILLHKPFDAMTIAMLMAKGGWSATARCVVNGVFALAIPAGVALFYFGATWGDGVAGQGLSSQTLSGQALWAIGPALAFSAGVFFCVSMSDLLPELQFHHHDRLKLSAALLLGLAMAYAAGRLEQHNHGPAPPSIDAATSSIEVGVVSDGD